MSNLRARAGTTWHLDAISRSPALTLLDHVTPSPALGPPASVSQALAPKCRLARTLGLAQLRVVCAILSVMLGARLECTFSFAPLQGQEEEWNRLNPEQKEALRRQYRVFKQLPPDQQEEIRRRLNQLRRMSPEERALIRENYLAFQKLNPEQRMALQRNYERWKNLPPQRQEQLRQNYRRLLKMSPQERKKLLDNYQEWKQKTPLERARIRQQRQMQARPLRTPPPAPAKAPPARKPRS